MGRFLILLASVLGVAILLAILRQWRNRPRIDEILPSGEMQKKYGLYAENRPRIVLDPSRVPEDLRDLIPMAEKWGIGDDIIRGDFEKKSPEADKADFRNALRGRTGRVAAWLDSFRVDALTEEAAAFMFMLEALDESGLWPDPPASGARA